MPKHDDQVLIDEPFPLDLGRFNCSGGYVMPYGTINEQERREAFRRIQLSKDDH